MRKGQYVKIDDEVREEYREDYNLSIANKTTCIIKAMLNRGAIEIFMPNSRREVWVRKKDIKVIPLYMEVV